MLTMLGTLGTMNVQYNIPLILTEKSQLLCNLTLQPTMGDEYDT